MNSHTSHRHLEKGLAGIKYLSCANCIRDTRIRVPVPIYFPKSLSAAALPLSEMSICII